MATNTRRAIGAAALVIMTANLLGSVLGFARGSVIARVFGDNVKTDAFFAASIVPQMFYDLTIGAAVSAALIPTLTEIAEVRGREDMARTVGTVLAVVLAILVVLVALLILFAQPLMSLLLLGRHGAVHHGLLGQAVPIVRFMVPSLLFLGTSAVFLSAQYSLRRFTLSAFAPSLYHLGIIGSAILLARPLGILALPVGATVGAAAQAFIQGPAVLRNLGPLRIRFAFTPDVLRILRLYGPVAAGLLVSIGGQTIDLIFKSHLETGAITAMQIATNLVQFPIGIAAAAMSFAILPSLSADMTFGRTDEFKQTLALGMRLVLFVTVPAAIGYLALASPIVALLFQHGKFHAVATGRTVSAVAGYAIQIPFVGVDQLLIFAFYARKNTVTPMVVGIVGVFIYVGSALLLMPRWQILGLALANTVQNSVHGLILMALMLGAIGTLAGTGLGAGLMRIAAASTIMSAGVGGCLLVLDHTGRAHGAGFWATQAGVSVAVGGALYLAVSACLRSDELRLLVSMATRR